MAPVSRHKKHGALSVTKRPRVTMQFCANGCQGCQGPSMAWTQVALFGHPYRGPRGNDFYCDPCVREIVRVYTGALVPDVPELGLAA